MKWQEIRRWYLQTWLLLEAIEAHTEGDKRILESLAVISSFDDSQEAMKAYAKLHQDEPQRELFVFHTDREHLDVTIRRWFLGFDFPQQAQALIDLNTLELRPAF